MSKSKCTQLDQTQDFNFESSDFQDSGIETGRFPFFGSTKTCTYSPVQIAEFENSVRSLSPAKWPRTRSAETDFDSSFCGKSES